MQYILSITRQESTANNLSLNNSNSQQQTIEVQFFSFSYPSASAAFLFFCAFATFSVLPTGISPFRSSSPFLTFRNRILRSASRFFGGFCVCLLLLLHSGNCRVFLCFDGGISGWDVLFD